MCRYRYAHLSVCICRCVNMCVCVCTSGSNLDLINTVTSNRVRQILFCILKPAVEGRCLLGKSEVQILNLAVLILQVQQLLLTVISISQQLLPARHHGIVPSLDGWYLLVSSGYKSIFQSCDGLDSFLFKCSNAG